MQPPPRHNFVVRVITFEGFKLCSSNLTHALLIQISRTSLIIDIIVPSKMAVLIWNCQKCHQKWISDIQNRLSIWNGQKYNQKWFSDIQNGHWKILKTKLSSVWIWNCQKCHRKWISDNQNGRSIWNQKSFSNIQNVHHRPFCQNLKQILYEMARNAIECEFQTSKMADGSHFVKKITKIKMLVLIWKWFLDIQNGYRRPFYKKHLQKKLREWFEQCSNRLLADYNLI